MSIPFRTRRSEFRAQARNPTDSWTRYTMPQSQPSRTDRFVAWLDHMDERMWGAYVLIYVGMCIGGLWLGCELIRAWVI